MFAISCTQTIWSEDLGARLHLKKVPWIVSLTKQRPQKADNASGELLPMLFAQKWSWTVICLGSDYPCMWRLLLAFLKGAAGLGPYLSYITWGHDDPLFIVLLPFGLFRGYVCPFGDKGDLRTTCNYVCVQVIPNLHYPLVEGKLIRICSIPGSYWCN